MEQKFSNTSWWVAFFVTLTGIGVSLYLTNLHFLFVESGALESALCNISSYVNCDLVLTSAYSHLGTLPLAGVGLLFYLYLLGILLYGRSKNASLVKVYTLPYLLLIVSVLLSLFLAYVSFFKIGAVCIFCSSLYVVNILLLIFIKKVVGMSFQDWMQKLNKVSWFKSFAYLGIVFVAGGILLHTHGQQLAKEKEQQAQETKTAQQQKPPKSKEEQIKLYLASFLEQPAQPIDIEGRPFWGNKDAKIVVVEFSDYECPYCKKAAMTIKPLLEPYRDQVKLVFMNYPLDKSCNPGMKKELHKRACATAYAASCAGQQGKFWEYHDRAFAKQGKFSPENLEKYAQSFNLDMEKFQACLGSEEAKKLVAADIAQGTKLGIRGTPAVFVNGRPFRPWMMKEAWDGLIPQLSK